MRPSVIPDNLTGKELFDFCVKNEDLIIHAKKTAVKWSDNLHYSTITNIPAANKAEGVNINKNLTVKLAISPSNYMDSHMDVHIPGLWNKSIADNKSKGFYLLKNHGRDFTDVIAAGMKAVTENIEFRKLGFNAIGAAEVMCFTGEITPDRNAFMYDQYAKGYVNNHSVGMQYVKMITCINDEDYPVQMENWNKYRPMVINGNVADEAGIFWAITDAKIIEGSAVLFGSNDITPTLSIETKQDTENHLPANATNEIEPSKSFMEYLNEKTLLNF